MNYLDFEKPIFELEKKIDELRKLDIGDNKVLAPEIKRLEAKVEELRDSIFKNLTRWQRVQLARHPDRPYTLDYIYKITERFMELHGDRSFGDDKAIVGGLGTINGQSVMIIGQQKGRDTKSRQYRNFGMPNPEGYRKALRLMKLAEKFGVPIVTLLDTPGAFPGNAAEERGQSEAIARNLLEMSQFKVPIICIIIGEGGSGGALALGVGNRVLMLENAIYSVASPNAAASILWKDSSRADEAAEKLRITSTDMLIFEIVEEIIPEPRGGAHRDAAKQSESIKKAICKHLQELNKLEPLQLREDRYRKFRTIGKFTYIQEQK
jgi:acetyl-CoA carboxylase carboxyl transferase subunit alpha